MGERIIGDTSEKNYFAPGIGLVRTVLSVDNKKYVYELCNYSIKGGDGLLPLCVGNRWNYKQVGCPEEIGQVIDRRSSLKMAMSICFPDGIMPENNSEV